MNDKIKSNQCYFTHSWLPDDVDPWADIGSLTSSVEYTVRKGRQIYLPILGVVLVLVGLCLMCCCGHGREGGRGTAGHKKSAKQE